MPRLARNELEGKTLFHVMVQGINKEKIFEGEREKLEYIKLMNQHKIDIEALNEKHRLDIETKEKEHQLKIEEIKVQNEQEILKREKELSNSAMYSMMGDATKDLFAGIFNSPEFKEEMSKKIKEGFNKK